MLMYLFIREVYSWLGITAIKNYTTILINLSIRNNENVLQQGKKSERDVI